MHSEDKFVPGEEQSAFEQELGASLRRVQAAPDFAAGVLLRIESEETHDESRLTARSGQPRFAHSTERKRLSQRIAQHVRVPPWFGTRPALAAALLLLLLVPLSAYLHERRQQAEAEATTRQFLLAMRLTQSVLLDTGRQIAQHGINTTQSHDQARSTTTTLATRKESR